MTKRTAANKRVFRRGDLLIVAATLAAAFIAWLFAAGGAPSDSAVVRIAVDGRNISSLALSNDGVYVLEGLYYPFTLHIEGGKVWVADVACPDGICEKTGRISRNHQAIVCLPNRVSVTIANPAEDTGADIVIY